MKNIPMHRYISKYKGNQIQKKKKRSITVNYWSVYTVYTLRKPRCGEAIVDERELIKTHGYDGRQPKKSTLTS